MDSKSIVVVFINSFGFWCDLRYAKILKRVLKENFLDGTEILIVVIPKLQHFLDVERLLDPNNDWYFTGQVLLKCPDWVNILE